MIRFKQRSTENELMDDLSLDEIQIRSILKDITLANKWLGGNNITIKALDRLFKEHPREKYTILDIGCGDGSMLREVADHCAENHIKTQLIGLDLNEKSINIAKESSRGYGNIRYLTQDVLALKPEKFRCDILLCTLTLHHFSREQIHTFIKKFALLATIGIIVNDLDRNKIGFALFKVFSLVFMKTHVAKHDGLVSIKSGFTKNDFHIFSRSVPSMDYKVLWRWAFRYEWILTHPNT
ncbi:methyltransferase domain-containing protein [uncultured Muriicola sp.]|uniref:methyltransferase domain-containing protein n=1 Tax=uncultured Muriicola sp. TaxID=1583102 RepID=UPI00263283D7|nr:methyltransferase domain-containing protein [uncultured Muriicola sp.]